MYMHEEILEFIMLTIHLTFLTFKPKKKSHIFSRALFYF